MAGDIPALLSTTKHWFMVHLMALQCKTGTELVAHMLIPGPCFTSHADLSIKQRMCPYHWVENKFCLTQYFHQSFSIVITGANFKMKFLVKNITSKKVLAQNPRSWKSLLKTASVKIVTDSKLRNSAWLKFTQQIRKCLQHSSDVWNILYQQNKFFLHCPFIWRHSN